MVTGIYAALLALIFIALSAYVVKARLNNKIALLDGDNLEVTKRIRAHANFIEYTPLFLILLYLCEASALNHLYIHILGIVYLMARISHLYSILFHERYVKEQHQGNVFFRARGMEMTFATICLMSLYLLTIHIF